MFISEETNLTATDRFASNTVRRRGVTVCEQTHLLSTNYTRTSIRRGGDEEEEGGFKTAANRKKS